MEGGSGLQGWEILGGGGFLIFDVRFSMRVIVRDGDLEI